MVTVPKVKGRLDNVRPQNRLPERAPWRREGEGPRPRVLRLAEHDGEDGGGAGAQGVAHAHHLKVAGLLQNMLNFGGKFKRTRVESEISFGGKFKCDLYH